MLLAAERLALANAGRRLAAAGLVIGTSGNLSVRAGHLHTSGVLHLELSDPGFLAELGPRKDMLGQMSMAFAAEGIVTLAGSRMYTSMADTDDVVDDALARFDRVFAQIGAA